MVISITVIEEWHPFYFLETQMRVYERMKTTLREFHDRSKTMICEYLIKKKK